MKLTKEQVQQVEAYIHCKGLNYIDLKTEVLDHMILDIETKLVNKAISFNQAFEEVKIKWKNQFKTDVSYWLGITHDGPMLLINKSVKIYKPIYKKTLLYLALLVAVLFFLKQIFSFDVLEALTEFKMIANIIILFVWALGAFYTLRWAKKLRKSSYNTSYRFLFKTQKLGVFLIGILLVIQVVDNEFIDTFYFIYMYILLFSIYQNQIFYQNHFKEVALYKKLQTL